MPLSPGNDGGRRPSLAGEPLRAPGTRTAGWMPAGGLRLPRPPLISQGSASRPSPPFRPTTRVNAIRKSRVRTAVSNTVREPAAASVAGRRRGARVTFPMPAGRPRRVAPGRQGSNTSGRDATILASRPDAAKALLVLAISALALGLGLPTGVARAWAAVQAALVPVTPAAGLHEQSATSAMGFRAHDHQVPGARHAAFPWPPPPTHPHRAASPSQLAPRSPRSSPPLVPGHTGRHCGHGDRTPLAHQFWRATPWGAARSGAKSVPRLSE